MNPVSRAKIGPARDWRTAWQPHFNRLNRGLASFARANSDDLVELSHKDFAITHLPGLCSIDDRVDDLPNLVFMNDDFDFDFRNKVNRVFISTIHFRVTLLPTGSAMNRWADWRVTWISGDANIFWRIASQVS